MPTGNDFTVAGIKQNLADNINLGLDLKGGSHLVMRVKTDDYLKTLTDNNAEAALNAAKDKARGHEAVVVSHQLPIWILRSYVERRRLWHDPRKRQCTLASLTTFTFQGDRIVSVGYTEPARDLVPAHLLAGAKPVKGQGKAFGA